jgi:hypothetical protein
MPTTVLQSWTKGRDQGKVGPVDVSVTANVTTNNARLYYHTDGNVYERVGTDGSGNPVYRNQKRERV